MATWNSRGLRGSTLEDFINLANEKYQQSNLALIQKIPTPIKPIKIDKDTRHITLAYFDMKSTVDYIGVVQGIPVCFDAKETAVDIFPLQNIHEHQVNFMSDEFYYVPFCDIISFWNRGKNGGRKSFTYDEIDKSYRIHASKGVPVHYLDALQKDIMSRD